MALYYVLAENFGAEMALIEKKEDAPKGAKVVESLEEAQKLLEQGTEEQTKALEDFIAEADKELPREEDDKEEKPEDKEKPTPPGQEKPKPRKDKKGK